MSSAAGAVDNTSIMSFSRWGTLTTEAKLWLLLRMFVCWEFVGHGAFGVITKKGWLPFFAVVGIPEDIAWKLMPVVGTFDIAMGILVLFSPRKSVLLWMTMWGVWTALLRPLSGTSFSEFFERAYNMGTPFLLLYFLGFGQNLKDWFSKVEYPKITKDKLQFAVLFLRISIASYMLGHAAFGIFDSQGTLLGLHEASGIGALFGSAAQSAKIFGYVEALLGIAVLLKPANALLVAVIAWKVFTEGLYIPFGKGFWAFFEFIERGGSYAMPMALIYIKELLAKSE